MKFVGPLGSVKAGVNCTKEINQVYFSNIKEIMIHKIVAYKIMFFVSMMLAPVKLLMMLRLFLTF